MKIPVFVSCPTTLNQDQQQAREIILDELDKLELEPRALGFSDYPTELPLREVYVLAKHCAGGVILGFEQIRVTAGLIKRGSPKEKPMPEPTPFPTPWNQLEAGILFGMGLPLLVFREEGITGGIFDLGVTDLFIHKMPDPKMADNERKALTSVFLKWQARVREVYYR